MADFKKGMMVWIIEQKYSSTAGEYARIVNKSNRYTIRSIGKKQAVLDRIYDKKPAHYIPGMTYYLTSPRTIEHYRDRNPGSELPSHYYVNWSQLLCSIGEDGWDSEENYGLSNENNK